jgi:hypothetical protein
MKKILIPLLLTLITSLATTGCNALIPSTAVPTSAELVPTIVALTLQAITGQTLTAIPPTLTPVPPTATPAFTGTPVPSPTAGVTAAPGYILCDQADFVGDITIPDDDVIPNGTTFKKIWALKNTGACTWDDKYQAVFVSGDLVGAPRAIPLPGPILPNGIVLVTVTFKVPDDAPKGQNYVSFWKLSDPAGNLFGIPDKNKPFYVKFKAGDTYNFLVNQCSAAWSNATDLLYCPSGTSGLKGYFYSSAKPHMENNLYNDSPALVMAYQAIPSGQIKVKFAPIIVPNDWLHTEVGCMYDTRQGCDVEMGISASVDGGDDREIANDQQTYDGYTTGFDVNLNKLQLKGKSVSFTFWVQANNTQSDQRELFWINPRIGP